MLPYLESANRKEIGQAHYHSIVNKRFILAGAERLCISLDDDDFVEKTFIPSLLPSEKTLVMSPKYSS
jgi:hypothetical protein